MSRVVGITSGVFDLLHVGHVRYLERCHALCDRLIVLVDSDDLVRERKGNSRPIIPLSDRMKLLETLRIVFLVYPMPSLDAWEQCIKLHRLSGDTVRIFKHEGFADKEVVGANQPGVELIFVPDVPGLISTSEIIDRVKSGKGRT